MPDSEPGTEGNQATTGTAAAAAPTRLMVILFTDIVGSVDLKKRLGDSEAARMIARHDELFRKVVGAATGAEIVQDTGDGFLARFATVKGAVETALRFQHAVRSEPWREQPIQVRAGLHLGDVAATGKISALAVDIASRVMGLAMPGQILMTRAVFDDARQHVRKHPGADDQRGESELRWMAHGPYLFKGSDEPMDVCEVGVERVSPLRPPPDSEKVRRAIKAADEQRYGLRPAVAQPVPQNDNWILQSRVGGEGSGEVWLARDTRTGASREFTFDFAGDRVRSEDHAANGSEFQPGERVGNYVIRQRIGEGGFAIVYAAEQEKPVRRKVALKIIKLGMDTKQVIARFEAERQALAMMDHPNVAKVFDAGATDTGRPYFVMEHVPGVSITEHCDRQRLNIEERLELFMQVCVAVQHAHQKGIIHRDIKPSNVLVLIKDGKATPKVIDFGVAKAISHRLTEQTIYTEQGQLIGTPEYMSPEQAEMTAQDIDTRSDIYSLGVVLYELLTGALPFDPTTLRRAAFGEIQRIIREQEPRKPSTRLSSLGEYSTIHAQKRRADPKSLVHDLRGDLDWITMKALEKDRARRYETANDLAADLRRHLNDEPVLAGPPSTVYHIGKFVRRNRTLVGAAVLLLAVLVAGIIGTTTGMVRAILASERESRQRDKAERQATIAQTVIEFLNVDLLRSADPRRFGRDGTAREVIDAAAEKLESRFEDEPLVEASIRQTIGSVYANLGEYESAEPHVLRAYQLRRRELGEEHPETLMSMHHAAVLYNTQGRYEEAEALQAQVLETRTRVLGEAHPNTLTTMNNLAEVYSQQGRYDEAELLHVQALEMRRQVLGEDHDQTLQSASHLAWVYYYQGKFGEAEALWKDTLPRLRDGLGSEHQDTLNTMNGLAWLYRWQDRADEAEPLFAETLEIRLRVFGEDHLATLRSMIGLAAVYTSQRRLDEAETLLRRALPIGRRVLGDEHKETLTVMNDLAYVYKTLGRYEEAAPLFSEALESQRRVLGEENAYTLTSMINLGDAYTSMGRYEAAEPLLIAAVEGARRSLPEGHFRTGGFLRNYGRCLVGMGRYGEAETALLESHAILSKALGERHEVTLTVATRLSDLYDAWGKPEKAAEWRAKLPTEQDAVASDAPAEEKQEE